jgi:hypothetical protein
MSDTELCLLRAAGMISLFWNDWAEAGLAMRCFSRALLQFQIAIYQGTVKESGIGTTQHA